MTVIKIGSQSQLTLSKCTVRASVAVHALIDHISVKECDFVVRTNILAHVGYKETYHVVPTALRTRTVCTVVIHNVMLIRLNLSTLLYSIMYEWTTPWKQAAIYTAAFAFS